MNTSITPTPWTHFIQPVRNETIRTINSGHEKRIAEMCFSGNAAEYEANTEAIVSAVNSTYGNNINPEAVKEMYDLLVAMVDKEEKAYVERKKSADHFNNNVDGVGIKFDYEIPADVPKWVLKAKAVLDKAKL